MYNHSEEDNNLSEDLQEKLEDFKNEYLNDDVINNDNDETNKQIVGKTIHDFENKIGQKRETLDKKLNELKKLNIITAGFPGVGKSTLINSVFGMNDATTGIGKPVTTEIKEYKNPNRIPFLEIIDTFGLEVKKFNEQSVEIEKYIKKRSNDKNPENHVHVAWYCIPEALYRVQDVDIDMVGMLSKYMPVIVIITKAKKDANDTGESFEEKVKELIKQPHVVRVMAKLEPIEVNGQRLGEYPVMGLEELVEKTITVLPDAQKMSFKQAQIVKLEEKTKNAIRNIGIATIAAAGVGGTHAAFIPIPGLHETAITSIYVGMLVSISMEFGLKIGEGILSSILTSTFFSGIATTLGRETFTTLLRFTPLVALSSVVSAVLDAFGTIVLGAAYINTVRYIIVNDIEITKDNIEKILKEQLSLTRDFQPILQYIRDNTDDPQLRKIIDKILHLLP